MKLNQLIFSHCWIQKQIQRKNSIMTVSKAIIHRVVVTSHHVQAIHLQLITNQCQLSRKRLLKWAKISTRSLLKKNRLITSNGKPHLRWKGKEIRLTKSKCYNRSNPATLITETSVIKNLIHKKQRNIKDFLQEMITYHLSSTTLIEKEILLLMILRTLFTSMKVLQSLLLPQ